MSPTTALTWEEARALAYKIARAQRINHEDAEDIAQETCLRLLDQGPFGSGLVAVCAYQRIATWARRENARLRGEGAFLLDAVFPPEISPEEAADVRAALDTITDKQREVVEAYVLGQRTLREIGRMRGIDVRAAFELLTRGLSALARHLTHKAA